MGTFFYRNRISLGVIALVAIVAASVLFGQKPALAAEGEFYLQVSPSPIVATLKPGQATTLELKIRNAGSKPEKLKIQPRSFTINNTSGEVEFNDAAPPEVASWVHFSAQIFSVDAGKFFDQKITIDVPKDAGFSYSFALLITREGADITNSAGQQLKGQVAVFALMNIDRPGAVRKLEIDGVSTDQQMYEFLPATIKVRLKNTGNTIVQPAGDIFIQRQANDTVPLDTLAVNRGSGYIVPGSVRTLTTKWENGFLVNRQTTDQTGKTSENLDWNWSNIQNVRIGYYTAKVVAIYNDGQRDIPVTGEVGFWVIPWKILLVVLVFLVLIGLGVWSVVSRILSVTGSGASKIKRIKR